MRRGTERRNAGACVLPRLVSSFFVRIRTQLAKEAQNPHSELPVHSITFINAEVLRLCAAAPVKLLQPFPSLQVKIVKCLVSNILVDISANTSGIADIMLRAAFADAESRPRAAGSCGGHGVLLGGGRPPRRPRPLV